MKILLDIKNNKATHLMAVLKELPYVKTQELTPANARVLKELKEAVDNMILVEEGKLKPKRAGELSKKRWDK